VSPAATGPGGHTAAEIRRAFEAAIDLWGVRVELSPPEPWKGGGDSHWKTDEPLAYIDLETRQIVVNLPLLERMGARDSLTAVLAHEVGHHVRFPHSLGLVAALRVLELRLIPGLSQSLTNLFFDLQVNEVVGRTRAGELAAVYRGFVRDAEQLSPLFFFYLAIYEELWGSGAASLVPEDQIAGMERRFPGCRADARVFSQTFYELPGVYLQFIYFCSRFLRYVTDAAAGTSGMPLGSDVPAPDADDLYRAIAGVPGIEEALEETRGRGWMEESGAVDREEGDAFTVIDRVVEHLPGSGGGELRRALVSKHYRRLIEPWIIEIPGVSSEPEAFLPTITEDWEPGESPGKIDWTASVIERGALAGALPRQRELETDPPPEPEGALPWVEIYLDTSGSMPNPERQLNAMTLAAQILSASAIRRGGSVRGIVYSSGNPAASDWMRDEDTAREFLLGYIGGGTDYPFELLLASAEQRDDAIRVIISDSDFLYNVGSGTHRRDLLAGTERSRLLVALLAVPNAAQALDAIGPAAGSPRFRLVTVRDLSDFAAAAARLAEAVLGPLR
jgi:hypothetical protein